MNTHADPIIETSGWNCRYGAFPAVKDLNLAVPRGSIYALLGTNGAGKTTVLRSLLNLLPPSGGTARVLGIDVSRLGPAEYARIGYVSEQQNLPGDLSLGELIAYGRSIYPTWDDGLCRSLEHLFALPTRGKLAGFSRGMKVKASFLLALAYRPSLLILDEPFSGLDVLVRDELMEAMLELAESESWSVLLSTHDMEEVERLADWVGVMDHGRLFLSEPLEGLRHRFRRVDVNFADPVPPPVSWPENCLLPEAAGSRLRWITSDYSGEETTAFEIAHLFPAHAAFSTAPLTLREILAALARAARLKPVVAL